MTTLRIGCDASPVLAAISELERLAQLFPELVETFLSSLDSAAQLVRIQPELRGAMGAGELSCVLEPADRLADFLTAMGARNVQGV